MDAIRGVIKRMDALEKRDDDDDETVSIDSECTAPQALAADAERVHQEGFKVRENWDCLNKITMQPDTQDMFSVPYRLALTVLTACTACPADLKPAGSTPRTRRSECLNAADMCWNGRRSRRR